MFESTTVAPLLHHGGAKLDFVHGGIYVAILDHGTVYSLPDLSHGGVYMPATDQGGANAAKFDQGTL